ncbi:MAG: nuclear transport factor 2 family protein [Elainellaceae cyanobacterium]
MKQTMKWAIALTAIGCISISVTLIGIQAVMAVPRHSNASALASMTTPSPPANPESFTSPPEIRRMIRHARDAWLTGNPDRFAELFAADGEFIVPGQCWQGPADIRQAVAEFAADYSVLDIQIRQIVIDGDRAVVEWQWRDRNSETGDETIADDAIAIDFEAGQIIRWREYIDTQTPN